MANALGARRFTVLLPRTTAMPDRRRHRGPHPADLGLFAPEHHAALREAVADLSWLLTRGYAQNASLKLVGDRLQLSDRQRLAVMRSACSDGSLERRRAARLSPDHLAGRAIAIDGFNLLTTIEAALSGGILIVGRDGCYRDMASMHGSFRKVDETTPAMTLLGESLAELRAERCRWLFDRPVSNSGRIAAVVRGIAATRGWTWDAGLVDDPDAVLVESPHVVVSTDSAIIDRCTEWFDLAGHVVRRRIDDAVVVDLGRST